MVKKQVILMRAIKILFIGMLLVGFGGGCSTVSKKIALPAAKQGHRITDGVLNFIDLQQIDLDKDGEKEIVAIYAGSVNSSGVKVIKFSKGKGNIIFERIFNTPNTKFEMKNGIPTITFEEIGQVAGCRVKGAYYWDGKTFILEGK
jgi:hypothetical protein